MGRIEVFRLGIRPLKQGPRKIYVYLPNDYDTSDRIYPVLYMFDGHNLFSDETATYGKCWGLKDYLDQNDIPLVIIGQDCNHTGNMRLMEYCPLEPEGETWFPEGQVCGSVTADWFVSKLKPACEKRYHIHSDRQNVGIAGSSMGGLMSMYGIAKYFPKPHVSHPRWTSRCQGFSISSNGAGYQKTPASIWISEAWKSAPRRPSHKASTGC